MSGDTIITVVGNLVAEPELRYIPSGAGVINFTVASTPRRFDKDRNEWVDQDAMFLRCNLWRQPAENLAESNLQKGARVIVQGRLKQRSFEKDGEKRTVIELEVDEVGPSLRYAIAKVNKVSRGGSSGGGSGYDTGGFAGSSSDDSPPF